MTFFTGSSALAVDVVVVVAAWAFALAWLFAKGLPWLARERGDLPWVASLFVAALALRLALPWGPVNFVDGERLEVLWARDPSIAPTFTTVPTLLGALREVGVPSAWLMRAVPQVFGALAVAAAWMAARSMKLGRGGAAVAAAVLCAWPAHLHFSTALTFSVEGAALWLFAFAVAAEGGASAPWREPLLGALTALAVYARPEYRLMVLPLAALVLGPGWTWPSRGRAAAFGAAWVGAYAAHLAPQSEMLARSGMSAYFAPWLTSDVTLTPAWWTWLGALGLVLPSRPRWSARVAVPLAAALLVAAYWALASEANPLWGQWRYYVSAVPLVALGAGFFARFTLDRLRDPRARRAATAAFLVAAFAPLAVYLPRLLRPVDQAAEFAYLRATAPRVTARRPDVLLLANRGHGHELSGIAVEGNVLLALGASVGELSWPTSCEPSSARPRARDLELVAERCPETIDPATAVVYLGLSREDSRLAPLLARFALAPVDEVTRRVAVTSTVTNKQCVPAERGFSMRSPDAPPCAARLGWYRLVPR